MKTKTIFIYDSCGEEEIKFFVKDGDYSHLDRVYVNAADNEKLIDQLIEILESNPKMLKHFPRKTLIANPDAKIICVGFIP